MGTRTRDYLIHLRAGGVFGMRLEDADARRLRNAMANKQSAIAQDERGTTVLASEIAAIVPEKDDRP